MAARSSPPPPPPSTSISSPNPSSSSYDLDKSSRPSTDMEAFQLLGLLLPKVPLVIRVAIMHILRLSAPASYVDLRSELIVSITRSFLSTSRPWRITDTQKLSLRDPGIKGRIWVSTYASPVPPETGLRDALLEAIDDLRDHDAPKPRFRIPDFAPVEAEWTGYRAKAERGEALPEISEVEKYRAMMDECSSPTTVMYLHGGAFYLCDPSSHRPTAKKLAKLTGGRTYSVRYRLAPQYPFPAALLDAFVSYMTLLYPPPDAYHDAVAPEHIVFAGDSAGGNLVFSLTALLLHLRKKGNPVFWHGELRDIPLPAAICGNSPWVDLTQSATMWEGDKQAPFDYLPRAAPTDWHRMPPCSIWPTEPYRDHIYVDNDLVAHPLVTVAMVDSWVECPPVYICTGWELLALEGRWLAQKLVKDGVTVVFEEYEAMPHTFALVLRSIPTSKKCYDSWSSFIRQAVQDPSKIETRATTLKAKTLEVVERRFEELCEIGEEQMRDSIRAQAAGEVESKL
ncbi:hypothetical protein NLU13_8824 [Sarocladium strictum]|uniref:Alpha/beta hydrolase fold-3 domain-containing protein n=1 Tax=Sarocladium strictum TaxID=5046 RepID=A0AA39L3L5_SARSR|nr:hypothetical protein NLU13_8824 [Sarocladium strictum]